MSSPRIPLFKVLMSPEAKHRAAAVLDSGYVGEGSEVEAFERELGESLDVDSQRVVAVNSCTSALTLALHLCGVGPGDDVVTSAMTCSATITPIIARGARPVWADVCPDTGLIDPADVARRVTRKTRAVVGIDWGGRRCDYAAIRRAADGIPLIEDAAHCGPAPMAANSGDFVCLSFQAIKFLTTCDGGALICPPASAGRARLLRWHGLDRRVPFGQRFSQCIREAGYKFQMNDLAAAIGRANLAVASAAVRTHREHADHYAMELAGLRRARVPELDSSAHWWLFTLLVDDREDFIRHLATRGIDSSAVHARNDTHDAFHFPNGPLPGLDHFARREVAVPVGWWLKQEDRGRVIDAIREWAA